MDILVQVLFGSVLIFIIVLIYLQFRQMRKYDKLSDQNAIFLESIEKYIEIFNEQNVSELLKKEKIIENSLSNKKIKAIREDYKKKLKSTNKYLSEEHEMLIDFVTLCLSLLIKTPPTLRESIVEDNTDNEVIKKILKSKLSSIEDLYIPVSLLEIAISQNVSD
jgi:hypothetical protein